MARFRRFLLGSAFSFGLNLAITSFVHEILGWTPATAFALALVTVLTVNFFVLRHFVFEATSGTAAGQATAYLFSALGFRATEYLAFLVVNVRLGVPYLLTATVVLAVSTAVKFFVYGSKIFVRSAP